MKKSLEYTERFVESVAKMKAQSLNVSNSLLCTRLSNSPYMECTALIENHSAVAKTHANFCIQLFS